MSAVRQQDTAYFNTLAAAINDPCVVGALVYYLLFKDLSRYNVRAKPKTKEQTKQKVRSLQGFERYWHEVLTSGDFVKDGFCTDIWTNSVFEPTNNLLQNYRKFDKNSECHQSVQESQIAENICRACSSAQKTRELVHTHSSQPGVQQRGFRFPKIQQARDEFSIYLGCELAWD